MELMVATAILAFAVVGLIAAFYNTILLNETNRNRVTALNDAQYVLEDLRSTPYADIAAYAAPVFTNLSSEAVVLNKTIGSNIAEITVTVTWNERTRTRNVVLAAHIARQ